MKLIVEVSDEMYAVYKKKFPVFGDKGLDSICQAIANGIPLPENGKIVDVSQIYKAIPAEEDNVTGIGMTEEERDAYNAGIEAMYQKIQSAKPVIGTKIELTEEEYIR